jgi:hypothetical protein
MTLENRANKTEKKLMDSKKYSVFTEIIHIHILSMLFTLSWCFFIGIIMRTKQVLSII